MGCSKLREWVGTVTGKGVRWGRDSVGRSAPAFMVANTAALPPLTCMARGRTSSGSGCFCCAVGQLWAVRLFLQGLCRAENPPAVFACSVVLRAVFCLLPLFACHAHCPSTSCPRSVCFVLAPIHCALPPVHSMCARIITVSRAGGLFVR